MITPQHIEQKVFSVAHLAAGYSKKEVDAFLDECRDALDAALKEAEAAKTEMRRALNERTVQISAVPAAAASQAVSVESSITKILQRGQQLADEALAEAQHEAEKLKAEAMVEIDKAKADAAAEADKLKADAVAAVQQAQADLATVSSAKDTAAKILQNALSALSAPPSA